MSSLTKFMLVFTRNFKTLERFICGLTPSLLFWCFALWDLADFGGTARPRVGQLLQSVHKEHALQMHTSPSGANTPGCPFPGSPTPGPSPPSSWLGVTHQTTTGGSYAPELKSCKPTVWNLPAPPRPSLPADLSEGSSHSCPFPVPPDHPPSFPRWPPWDRWVAQTFFSVVAVSRPVGLATPKWTPIFKYACACVYIQRVRVYIHV